METVALEQTGVVFNKVALTFGSDWDAGQTVTVKLPSEPANDTTVTLQQTGLTFEDSATHDPDLHAPELEHAAKRKRQTRRRTASRR